MTTPRLLAIGFIFLCTAVAWSILGSTVVGRTGQMDGRLSQEVARLWGGQHVQVAPQASVRRPREVEEEISGSWPAFFFEGYTGLTITLGAVLTLFVLMQLTARVDWGAVFAKR